MKIAAVMMVVGACLLTACDPNSPSAQKVTLRDAFESSLKDPGSAEYSGEFLHGGPGSFALCGEVNARNGFGGYTGSRRFISAQTGLAEIESPTINAEVKFTADWREYCVK